MTHAIPQPSRFAENSRVLSLDKIGERKYTVVICDRQEKEYDRQWHHQIGQNKE